MGAVACGGAAPVMPCKPSFDMRARMDKGIGSDSHIFFEGSAEHGHEGAAQSAATRQALIAGLRTIAVKVTGEVIDEAAFMDGRTVVNIQSRGTMSIIPVEVRGIQAATCVDDGGGTARARVAVPRSEWARIQRVMKGGTALVVECVSQPEGACTDGTLRKVASAVKEAGFDLLSTEAAPVGRTASSDRDRVAVGTRLEAAFVVWVTLKADHYTTTDDVMYAYTEMSAVYAETSDGKVLRAIEPFKEKGAHYTELGGRTFKPIAAVLQSVDNGVKRLRRELRAWKR